MVGICAEDAYRKQQDSVRIETERVIFPNGIMVSQQAVFALERAVIGFERSCIAAYGSVKNCLIKNGETLLQILLDELKKLDVIPHDTAPVHGEF